MQKTREGASGRSEREERAWNGQKKKKGDGAAKGANGISGPQGLLCLAAQQATTQLLESTSCRVRWRREKGLEEATEEHGEGTRGFTSSSAAAAVERLFSFPIVVVVTPKGAEHLPSPRRCCWSFVIHGSVRTATISGSQ